MLGLLALVYVSRSRWVDRRLNSLIRRVLRACTDLPGRDLDGLLELSGQYTVTELAIEEGDWVAGRRLADIDLRDEGIAVLGINRSDGRYRGNPVGSTTVLAGDTLILYGQADSLNELDRRPRGPEGDARHRTAVERQMDIVQVEDMADLDRRAAAGDPREG
ncbi:MAG TPA: TrkA C-terminal domain-containing protein [Acidimicrobiales bacterium]|nr:TrkA C-terminal domain-containing protein [Acidimicrobiales bacterium]